MLFLHTSDWHLGATAASSLTSIFRKNVAASSPILCKIV